MSKAHLKPSYVPSERSFNERCLEAKQAAKDQLHCDHPRLTALGWAWWRRYHEQPD